MKQYFMLLAVLLLTSCTVEKMCLDMPELEVEQKETNKWALRGMNIGFKFNEGCVYNQTKAEEPETPGNDELIADYEKKIEDLEEELEDAQDEKNEENLNEIINDAEQVINESEQNQENMNITVIIDENETVVLEDDSSRVEYQLPELDALETNITEEEEEEVSWGEN